MSNYAEMWNQLLCIVKQREKQMEEDRERQRDDMKKIVRQFECVIDSNTGLPYLRRKTLGFFK